MVEERVKKRVERMVRGLVLDMVELGMEVEVGVVGRVGAVFQQVTVGAVGAVKTVGIVEKVVEKRVERTVKEVLQDTLVVQMVDILVGAVQAVQVMGMMEKVVNGLVEKEVKKMLEKLRKQADTVLQILVNQMVKMVDKTVGAVQAVGVVAMVEKVVNGQVEKVVKNMNMEVMGRAVMADIVEVMEVMGRAVTEE